MSQWDERWMGGIGEPCLGNRWHLAAQIVCGSVGVALCSQCQLQFFKPVSATPIVQRPWRGSKTRRLGRAPAMRSVALRLWLHHCFEFVSACFTSSGMLCVHEVSDLDSLLTVHAWRPPWRRTASVSSWPPRVRRVSVAVCVDLAGSFSDPRRRRCLFVPRGHKPPSSAERTGPWGKSSPRLPSRAKHPCDFLSRSTGLSLLLHILRLPSFESYMAAEARNCSLLPWQGIANGSLHKACSRLVPS